MVAMVPGFRKIRGAIRMGLGVTLRQLRVKER